MNPKSKGYGNLGRGSPKDLAKAHWSKMGRGCSRKGNGLRMPKERKWAEDAQKDEMGQGSLEAIEWVKEAENSMNTSLTVILGHGN